MCGIDTAIEYLGSKSSGDDMFLQIINRLKYVRDKDVGVKPKFHKGKYINDWYTCGNCGYGIGNNLPNYCENCGYRINWDSPRCMTGIEVEG